MGEILTKYEEYADNRAMEEKIQEQKRLEEERKLNEAKKI